ncbi:MAG: hypothetical protein U1F36_07125 [Planctomycetota bacterium]
MNTLVASRWLRRLTVPFLAVALLVMALNFGIERVPDARLVFTDGAVPGATCLLSKRPGGLRHGAVVFLATADGLAVARVDREDGERVLLAERGATAFPDGVPRAAVRGLLLSVISGASGAESADDR